MDDEARETEVVTVARRDRRGWTVAVALAVATAVTGVLLVAFRAVFMVNDDAAIESFVSGAYTGRPSPHLVFVGWAPGQLLAALYRLTSDVPWYGLMLLGAQVGCVAAVASLVWARRRRIGRLGCWMSVIVLAAHLPALTLTPTFTMTATVLAATAVWSWACSIDASVATSRWLQALALVCLLGAATLRWEAMLGAVATLAPSILVLVWRVRWRRAAVLGVSAGLLVAAVHVVDTAWSRHGAWSAYSTYNVVRGRLHGTQQLSEASAAPDSPAMQAVFVDNGWTSDDLMLFNYWLFDDATVYSEAHLERLLDTVGDAGYNAPLSVSLSMVLDGRRGLFALAGLCVLAACWRPDRRRVGLLVGQLAWSIGVFVLLASQLRIPDRVALPNLLGLSMTLLLLPHLLGGRRGASARERAAEGVPSAQRTPRWFEATLLASAAFLVVVPIAALRSPAQLSRANADLETRLRQQLQVLDAVDPEGRFVAVGAAVALEAVDPLATDAGSRTERVLQTGWPTFSPSYDERKTRLGLGHDLLADIASDDGVYLIVPPGLIDILERVYERRLGWTITATARADLGNGETVWSIRRSEEGVAPAG